MPKAGSTHITKLLLKTVPGEAHQKHSLMAEYNTDKYIIGSIRNPWDWYVSLWSFGCKSKGGIWNYVMDADKIRLKTKMHPFYFIKRLLYPSSIQTWKEKYANTNDPKLFRDWLKLIYHPQRKHDLQEGYANHPVSKFCGLMTYRYCRLYLKNFCDPKIKKSLKNMNSLEKYSTNNHFPNKIIKIEDLNEDLISALLAAGFTLDQPSLKYIHNKEKTNTSIHQEKQFYYDQETIDLVHEKETYLINKYNYTYT